MTIRETTVNRIRHRGCTQVPLQHSARGSAERTVTNTACFCSNDTPSYTVTPSSKHSLRDCSLREEETPPFVMFVSHCDRRQFTALL